CRSAARDYTGLRSLVAGPVECRVDKGGDRMGRESTFIKKIQNLAVALLCGLSVKAAVHHAFSTEFDANLTGEVRGEVVKVWWANPHIRYDVRVTLDDGTVEEWTLAPPGNLPSYRREGWFEHTVQPGYLVRATGNLGRDGTKRLYATCIHLESGPERGRRLGPCSDDASRATTQVTAD